MVKFVCRSIYIFNNNFKPNNIVIYLRLYHSIASSTNQYVVGGGTKTIGMFSKLVSQGSSFVMEGVKNLVVKRHVSFNDYTNANILLLYITYLINRINY